VAVKMVLLHQHLVGSILLNLPIKLARHQDHPYLQKVSAFKYLGNSLCFDDDATRRDALLGHPQNCLQLMRTYFGRSQNSYLSSYQYLYFEARFKDSFY